VFRRPDCICPLVCVTVEWAGRWGWIQLAALSRW
jgi:hypothetical protein